MHILQHFNCRKSQDGLSISYLHIVSPLFLFLFLFINSNTEMPLHSFSISLTSLFPFHPATTPSHLPRFLSFPARCGDERFEQHSKLYLCLTSSSTAPLFPQPPLLSSSSASFDSSNCSMVVHMQTHSTAQQETTFPSIKNKIKHLNIPFLLLLFFVTSQ